MMDKMSARPKTALMVSDRMMPAGPDIWALCVSST